MPAVSKAQQRFMGMVYATKKGDMTNPSPEVAKAAASMKKSDAKDFASTKHKKLPEKKVAKEATDFLQRDKIMKKAKPLHKHLFKNLHKGDTKGDVNEVEMVPSTQEKSSEIQKENQDENSNKTNPITGAIEESKDSKFKFPKSKLEQKRRAQKTLHKNSEENEKKSNNYHYVILESVPKERFLKPDENEDATSDPRTNITSCISNLVPEFKFTWGNFKMWSINNFLSLNNGWDEAKRLVDNRPALIKKTSDSLEARVLENELKENKALTNILSHDKFVDIYGDPPKPMLRKMVQIPVAPTVSLNFKTLKRNPKDHLLNLRFMDLISLLLYCFGGIITVFGLNDLSQTLFGSLIFFLGTICHKGFKHFLQDQTVKTDKEEIYGSRWKTSIQYKETKKSLYIKFIGYFFCIIGVIVIWSGITDIKNLILGILSFSFGRWSWPWITKDNQK